MVVDEIDTCITSLFVKFLSFEKHQVVLYRATIGFLSKTYGISGEGLL